jgi:hypothetical protein
MDPEPGEFRDFPEPSILINDDVAHPFSSPIHAETINQPLTDLPEVFDSSFYSNLTFESTQSMESDIDMTKILSNNNIKTKIIENDNEIEEHSFDNDINLIDQQNSLIEKILTNIKSFDINQFHFIIENLNKKFKYLEKESERAQRITTNFQK